MKQQKQLTAWLLLFLIVLLLYPSVARSQTALKLDDFEGASIRVVQPGQTDPRIRYLWGQFSPNGTWDFTTEDKHDGSKSLKSIYTGGTNWQFQFYPNTGEVVNHYQYAKYFVTGSWANNTYNRLKFWIKVPAGVTQAKGGDNNFQFGTYTRCSTCDVTSAESDGGHWYHHFDLAYTGAWEQMIIDFHPSHKRTSLSNSEEGVQQYPTGESGLNYFDLLTRFYLDFPYLTLPNPSNIYLDGFEFYTESNTENEDQVYSVHAVYVPSTNTVKVGWLRNKNEDSIKHDVKYSFSDIHQIGWNAATPAPSGTDITPPGSAGYNGMYYTTAAINVAGHSTLYIGIKPQNTALFKQIAIPITEGAQQPAAPSGLQVK